MFRFYLRTIFRLSDTADTGSLDTDVYFEAPQKFLLSLVYNFETMPTVTHQTQSSYIHRFPDLKLSWSGDYESLRSFVDSEYNR